MNLTTPLVFDNYDLLTAHVLVELICLSAVYRTRISLQSRVVEPSFSAPPSFFRIRAPAVVTLALFSTWGIISRKKDWINSGVGGLAAGAAVAMLSKHTRSPRIVGAHAIGGCVVTSAVSILSTSSGTEDGGL